MATLPLPFLFFSVLDASWHKAKVISRIWQGPGKCTAAAVSNACLLILHKPLPPLGAEKLTESEEYAWRADTEAPLELLAGSGALVRVAAASPHLQPCPPRPFTPLLFLIFFHLTLNV